MQVLKKDFSVRYLFARLIRLYGAVFVANTCYRVLASWLGTRRMKRMLAKVPMLRSPHDMYFGNLPAVLTNIDRRHDWVMESTVGQAVSWTHGVFIDPYSVELVVNDSIGIKHFLSDNFDNYTKPQSDRDIFYRHWSSWAGEGFHCGRHGPDARKGGQNWMRHRKIAAAIVSSSDFNDNVERVLVAKGRQLCSLLAAPAFEGTPVDMQAQFFNLTMDTMIQLICGLKSDTLGGKENLYAVAFNISMRNIIEFVYSNLIVLVQLLLIPLPFGGSAGILAKIFTWRSACHKNFREANAALNSESRRIIREARASPELPNRKDFLALVLQAEPQEVFSEKWLRDAMLNLVYAGYGPSACTLSWLLHILATHPRIQDKVCQEIDERLPAEEQINFMAVSHAELPYLHGVLYETLRLFPPVPEITKEAVADDVLPDGTPVPMNAKVTYVPFTIGRDPERYPNPLVVKPERWIPFKEPQPYDFPVFQAGPRMCLGKSMAVSEVKIVVAMLLRNYVFEISPSEASKITHHPTNVPMSICNSKTHDSHNLWLTPKRRRRRSLAASR